MAKEKVVVNSGKRKSAIARCRIKPGNGVFRINKAAFEFYDPELARLKIKEPLQFVSDKIDALDISVNVKGGGVMGRADAIRTALAKSLVDYFDDEELKQQYLDYDRSLLVSDTRQKEPKHPLGRGARRKKQKSYR